MRAEDIHLLHPPRDFRQYHRHRCNPSHSTQHAATSDGWFLSDFYAFNYLLKGVAHPGDEGRNVPGQVWPVWLSTRIDKVDKVRY
jgi:hypothetical protein